MKKENSRKPIIGVMPLYDDEKDSIWMLKGYFDGLKAAGAIPAMVPLNIDKEEAEQINEMFDGYLFTGGHDVNPTIYGEAVSNECGITNESRDNTERLFFGIARENDKPILGICRGLQIINVFMGGTLYQDLDTERPSQIEHHMVPPYDRVQHLVSILENSPLYELLNKSSLGVNSYHHQAIKALGSDLEAMAFSEDGLVEAVRVKTSKFIWAFQWHPEFCYKTDENSMKIFKYFVENCY